MSPISQNLQAVHEAITHAAQRYGRNPTDIVLLAVSKTFPAEDVVVAWQAGQNAFGENYVQEGVDKIARVAELLGLPKENTCAGVTSAPEWHFIGPIQSNKTRPIAEHFSWVHSIDRDKIASRLSEQRPSHLPPLHVCIQVNISGEASKSGIAPDQCAALARHIQSLPRLQLRGLMAVPEATEDEAAQRRAFAALRELSMKLAPEGIVLDTLSMGMSGDMAAAVAEGSTMLRIGSAIFGKRNYAV
jgi:pyridoxal phosphate enzyme (YggS family)